MLQTNSYKLLLTFLTVPVVSPSSLHMGRLKVIAPLPSIPVFHVGYGYSPLSHFRLQASLERCTCWLLTRSSCSCSRGMYFHLIYSHPQLYGYVFILKNKGKERENSYQKLKRSPEERDTQTHRNVFKIFQWSQMSFSIRRE